MVEVVVEGGVGGVVSAGGVLSSFHRVGGQLICFGMTCGENGTIDQNWGMLVVGGPLRWDRYRDADRRRL